MISSVLLVINRPHQWIHLVPHLNVDGFTAEVIRTIHFHNIGNPFPFSRVLRTLWHSSLVTFRCLYFEALCASQEGDGQYRLLKNRNNNLCNGSIHFRSSEQTTRNWEKSCSFLYINRMVFSSKNLTAFFTCMWHLHLQRQRSNKILLVWSGNGKQWSILKRFTWPHQFQRSSNLENILPHPWNKKL